MTGKQLILGAALLFFAGQAALLAQNATVTRNVLLRRDPSVASPILEHLPKATRLVLVDAAAQAGFYHVRTEDELIGWVWSKFIAISQDQPVAGTVTHSHPNAPQPADAQCDAGLWNHVYNAQRLIVIERCIAVTGTIVDATAGNKSDGVRHEKDGDTHGWLNLDPAYASLLNAGNRNAENGNLVFEIVCRYPVTQPDAKAACKGFTDGVTIPSVGSHVRVVGAYVQDTFHAHWMEIHPVTSITLIP